MSSDQDSIYSELSPDKRVKRVRFSDEVADVYEYDRDEIDESFYLESENNTASSEPFDVELNDFSSDATMKKDLDSSGAKETDCDTSLSVCCDDKVDELTECTKPVTITSDSAKEDLQCSERSASFTVSRSPPPDCFNNNDTNMVDLNLLIHETKQLSISPPEQVQEVNRHLPSETFGVCASCDSNSEKNVLKTVVQPTEKTTTSVTSMTRKRCSGGTLKERQSSKLNTCLQSQNSDLSSAIAIKDAVFNAWNAVKSESAKDEIVSVVPEVKEKTDVPPKRPDKKIESKRDVKLRSVKRGARKISFKESEPVVQKKKEDMEESKMAFRAWKKKKDELLIQQIAEKLKREEKKRLDALMKERMRKSDAESAYIAWISHKTAVFKKEKKKSQWLLEKEKEKLNEKIKKNDEAAKVYYKWLRSKVFSKNKNSNIIMEDKPPWTPPGKGNSLI